MSPLDPAPLQLTDLVAELDWLRGLARRLLTDESDADELSQEVALCAIESRPRGLSSLRGWLRRVSIRHAARERNRNRQRSRIESARAPSVAQPAADDLCGRVEIQRVVVDAVLALPRGQREVVLRRFFDAQPPRRIARELDLPLETVKSRLQRGLATLRQRLGRRLGDGGSWRLALAPLAGPILAPASLPTTGAAVLSGLSSLIIMTKSSILVPLGILALGALSAVGYFGWPSSSEDSAPDVTGDRVGASASELQEGRAEGVKPADSNADRVAVGSGQNSSIRVQVRDSSGRPAPGIPLRVDQLIPGRKATLFRGAGYEVLWRGETTEPDGIATLPTDLPWDPSAVGARVFADIHVADPQVVAFRRNSPPTDLVRLDLPSLGSVDVRFVSPGGRHLPVSGEVRLFLDDHARRTAPVPDLPLWGTRQDLESGRARFPFVGVGETLRVVAQIELVGGHYDNTTWKRTIEFARLNTPEVRVDFVLGRPELRGRLLSPDGQPLRNSEVRVGTVSRFDKTKHRGSYSVRTDDEGEFRLFASWSKDGAEPPQEVYVQLSPLGEEGQPGPWCHVRVPTTPAIDRSLGDLRLRAASDLRWGSLVGSPSKPPELELQMRGDVGWLMTYDGVPRRANSDGRFWIRPSSSPGRYRIRYLRRGQVGAWHEFDARVLETLKIKMESGARLRFRVSLDDEIDASSLRLLAHDGQRWFYHTPTSTDERPSWAEGDDLISDPLAAGSYKVQLRLGREILHEIPRVEVRGEEVIALPVEGPLDLRGTLQRYEWKLQLPSGVKTHEVSAQIVARDAQGKEQVRSLDSDADGLLRFTLRRGVQPRSLSARGYRPVLFRAPSLRETVHLERRIALRARVPDMELMPERPYFLTLRVVDQKGEVCGTWPNSNHVPPSGEIVCNLPGPGRYRVRWCLGIMKTPRTGGFARPHEEPIDGVDERIVDVTADLKIAVPLSGEALKAARERLAQRLKDK